MILKALKKQFVRDLKEAKPLHVSVCCWGGGEGVCVQCVAGSSLLLFDVRKRIVIL